MQKRNEPEYGNHGHSALAFFGWLLRQGPFTWTLSSYCCSTSVRVVVLPAALAIRDAMRACRLCWALTALQDLGTGVSWRPHGDSNPGYRRERAMS